jgi:hypothetical protein
MPPAITTEFRSSAMRTNFRNHLTIETRSRIWRRRFFGR